MEEDRKTGRIKKMDRVWFVSLVFSCLFAAMAAAYYGFVDAGDSSFFQNYLAGFVLLVVLMQIVGIYKKRIGIFFNAVFFIAALALIFGEKLGADSRASFAAIAAQAKQKAAVLERKENNARRMKQEVVVAEQYLYSIFDEAFEIQHSFVNDLDNAGWTTVADPERLRRDTELIETNQIIEKGKGIFQKCEQTIVKAVENSPNRIDMLDIEAQGKTEIRAFWDMLLKKTTTRVAQEKKIRDEIVAEMDSMRGLLLNRDRWHIQGSEIVFVDADDLAAFTMRKKKIQDFIHKEIELQEEILNFGYEARKAVAQKK